MSTPVSQLIDAKGGNTAFAEKLNKSPGVIRMWRNRKKLPRSAWPEILEAFPDLTIEALKETEGRSV